MWQRDEADDLELAERAEKVRKRFQGTKTSKLPRADREFILDTVSRYNRDALPDVQQALGE